MNPSKVECPKCHHEFSPNEAYSHQIEESIRKKVDFEKEEELTQYRKKMRAWEEDKEKEFKNKEEEIKKKVLEDQSKESKSLKEELEAKNKVIQEARDNEIKIRQEKNKLEEEKKSFELEKLRQLDEERQKIREDAAKQLIEEHRFKDAEKDKKMADMARMIEDLKLKSELTSQQLQGEVQELEIEKMLKTSFPFDEISEIKKGVRGADTLQIIRDQTGKKCGSILWESKRTKDWENPWVIKLKEDMGKAKADIGIIISNNLPKDVRSFGFFEGIFVSDFISFIALAQIMRLKIIDLFYAKLSGENKEDKKEILWQYLRSNEFKQRVEGIIDYFEDRRMQIDKQRRYFNTEWAKEEKLIEKVLGQTAGLYGDLQGLMGASLPQIPSLEITTTKAELELDSNKIFIEETKIVADNFSQVEIESLTHTD